MEKSDWYIIQLCKFIDYPWECRQSSAAWYGSISVSVGISNYFKFCPFKDTEDTSEALACSSLVEDPTKLLINYLPDS